jgi:malate/lactate dehydrogenase
MTASVLTRIVEGDQVAAQEVGSRMAAYYEIRIKGRIGDSLLLAFEGLTVSTEPVETILHGPLPDQEALHELLAKIQSVGLEVVELRRLPATGPDSDVHPPPPS